jgi:hypothetical protein
MKFFFTLKLFSILLCLCFSVRVLAHTGSLSGKICDYFTGEPVASVVIALNGQAASAVSDSTGQFRIFSLPPQKHTVQFFKEGFAVKELQVYVEDERETRIDVLLTPAVIDLPALVVQAGAPVSAASSRVLTLLDFELRPKNSAQDMLRLVPGLFIAQHAGGGKAEQIFVRGFDCDHGTDVATYVDGIPVNMPSHGHGQGYADLHFLIPEVAKSIEVSKGPYFAQNGDFSTGATIRFNTLDDLEKNEVKVELGTAPSQRGFMYSRALLMLKLPIESQAIGSYFAGDYSFVPGYFDAEQDFFRYSAFSKTHFHWGENTRLALSLGGFGSSWNASGQVPVRAIKSGLIDRFGYIDSLEGGITSRNNLNLEFSTKVGGNNFYSQVFASDYRFKLFSNFTFYLDDPVNGDMIEQTDDRSILGLNARYEIPGAWGSLTTKTTVGGGFRSDKIENSLWHSPGRMRESVRAHANVFERGMNAYVKEEIIFANQFTIEAALRTDYYTFDVEDLLPSDSFHANYSGYNYQFLAQPKLNIIYSPSPNLYFFLNSGIGFHSNDARSVVQDMDNHRLPMAAGAELGTLMRIGPLVFSAALWQLELEDELVYVGDDGTTEDKGPSRRRGVDLSARYQIVEWLFADADVNLSQNVFVNKFFGDELIEENLVPLAPTLTSTGGITALHPNGWEGSLRYRYIKDRPANESNTVTAEGYSVIDLGMGYHTPFWRVGLNIENLLNTEWNEAQFDTESRLFDEPAPVDELHFTPGTPLAVRLSASYYF